MSASFFGGSKQNKNFIWILVLTFFIVAFLSFSAKSKGEQNSAAFNNEADGMYKPVLDNAGIFSKGSLNPSLQIWTSAQEFRLQLLL